MKIKKPFFILLVVMIGMFSCKGKADYYYIADGVVNVRSGPGTDNDVVFKLRAGDTFKEISRQKEKVKVAKWEGYWCEIEKNGQKGWVLSTFMAKAESPDMPLEVTTDNSHLNYAYKGEYYHGIPFNKVIILERDVENTDNAYDPYASKTRYVERKVVVKSEKGPVLYDSLYSFSQELNWLNSTSVYGIEVDCGIEKVDENRFQQVCDSAYDSPSAMEYTIDGNGQITLTKNAEQMAKEERLQQQKQIEAEKKYTIEEIAGQWWADGPSYRLNADKTCTYTDPAGESEDCHWELLKDNVILIDETKYLVTVGYDEFAASDDQQVQQCLEQITSTGNTGCLYFRSFDQGMQ